MSSHAAIVTPTPEGYRPHTVAHHFTSAEQEFQACKLGFWLFLATEILLFGGLFAAYFYFKGLHEKAFVLGAEQLAWELGTLNTAILLLSSWTMAMAVSSAQLSQKKACFNYCLFTVAGAAGFMVVKAIEYTKKFNHGLLPGRYFTDSHGAMLIDGARPEGTEMFFSLYFTMTGIHGLHVVIGAALIIWVMFGVAKGRFHSGYYLPVDLVGLYWHLVDLIWIFLFPLLYLVP